MGEVQQKLRQGNVSGDQLKQLAQTAWSEFSQQLPQQFRQELGQVMTELNARIDYVCSGHTPTTQTKYSALDGSSLAQHAQRTIHRISQELPIEHRDSLEIVREMAQRVEHVSVGSPVTWGGDGGQFESQQQGKKSQTTFA